MRSRIRRLIVLILLLSACGATPATVEPLPGSTALDPLTGHEEVALVSQGYGFTEGPQWMPKDEVLRFTADNTIFQVAVNDKVTTFRKPSNGANGLALDPQGRMIAA